MWDAIGRVKDRPVINQIQELTMAYLQITLDISEQNRAAAAAVYAKSIKPRSSATLTARYQKNCWYVKKMFRFCMVLKLNNKRRLI
jgi:hypothetical protein